MSLERPRTGRRRRTPGPDAGPDSPTELAGSGRGGGAASGTVKEFQEDNITDWAAALTYYGVLSIFPGAAGAGVAARPARRRRHADGAGHGRRASCPARRSRSCVDDGDRQGADDAGHGRLRGDHRSAAGLLVGVGLHRRLHARLERHLRRARGPADLEDAADPARRHRGHRRDAGRSARSSWSSPATWPERSATRSASARPAVTVWNIAKWPVLVDPGQPDVRDPLLGLAERQARRLPLGQPRRHLRRGALAAGLRPLRVLRGQLRSLQQDVRHAGRR